MPLPDLQGPYDDFLGRTFQIRAIVVSIESTIKAPNALTTTRPVDLTRIGPQTSNTVTAMSLVFLASSFEEFVREEISQCSGYMAERYAHLADEARHSIRNAYWGAALERLRFAQSILTKKKPKVPDATSIAKVRVLLDSVQGFVVRDDASLLDRTMFAQHSNNFRPHVVNEIANRLGITELLNKASDSNRLRSYFGVTKKTEVSERLLAKLGEFYDRRNEIVHSLSSSTGYAVDVVLDYIELFEATADSIRNALLKELAKW